MKKNTLICTLILTSSCILSGCASSVPKTQSEENSSITVNEETPSEDSSDVSSEGINASDTGNNPSDAGIFEKNITFDKECYSDNRDAKDGTNYFYASFEKAIITIKDQEETSHKINQFFEDQYQSLLAENDETANTALDEYNSLDKNEDNYFNGYSISESYDPERIDDSVISVKNTFYYYTNGAHGMSVTNGYNFDTKTGELLTLSSIASDESQLKDSILSYIKEICQTPKFEGLLFEDYETSLPSIITEGSWYFTKGGLLFHAGEYSIAPYASGDITFEVPYDKLTGLKEEYSYHGNFQRSYPVGTSADVDLDGDGSADNLVFDTKYDEENYDLLTTLTINDKDYSNIFTDNSIYLSDGFYENYTLVDLDTNDSYIELAVMDHGPSDDPVTYFFRYDHGNVSFLGGIGDVFDHASCYADGDSEIHADIRIALLETRTAPMVFTLNSDGTITQKKQDWYYPISYESDQPNHILQDITVYMEPSLDSEKVVLQASDNDADAVTFPALDNEHWVQVKKADGSIYYMYMQDFSDIDSDGKSLYSMETFDHLIVAD